MDIDDPVLRDLKEMQKREGKSLGRLISDLLAHALGQRRRQKAATPEFRWATHSMGARVDLADRDAVYDVMEPEPAPSSRKGRRR